MIARLEEDQLINSRSGIKSQGKRDGIIAMYNPHGNLKWVHSFGSREQDVINALSISENNNVCIGGYFSGKLNFSPEKGLLNKGEIRIASYLDCFVQCLVPPSSVYVEVNNSPLAIEEIPLNSGENNMVQFGTTIYPNPTANTVFIEFPLSAESIEINFIDMKGNSVKRMESVGETNLQLDIRDLASGTYILQITLDQFAFSERIVIAR
ncbi:MAG: T9SS type A sorting domain-containing protein [Flavobacteriales bacterium]|nr:T9SS type A sorting domain-containing protein [Flavobacteriales bacterium]